MSYILILDTETVSKNTYFSIYDHHVFDFGFVIADTDTREIVETYDVFIEEIWSNEDYMKHFFFSNNYLEWYKDNLDKKIVTMKQAASDFRNYVAKYKIEDICIYNATFDINALKTTTSELCGDNIIDLNDFHIVDIYHVACQALRDDEQYKVFCENNNYVTEKGNIQSNVQSVYSYITGNVNFEEAHTALADAIIEKEIYFWTVDRENTEGYEYIKKPNPSCWRLVQRKKQKK